MDISTYFYIPVLYILSKIFKDPVSPQGKPIVLGRDSVFIPSAQPFTGAFMDDFENTFVLFIFDTFSLVALY